MGPGDPGEVAFPGRVVATPRRRRESPGRTVSDAAAATRVPWTRGDASARADAGARRPVVKISEKLAPPGVEVYAKCEYFNPLSSVKDRLAVAIIEDAETRGELKPGMTVVEATSGNTGIAVAMVCAQRGAQRRGIALRHRRGRELDIAAAAGSWIFRGDQSRRRRGRELDIPRGPVEAPPRPRGPSPRIR